MSVVSYLEIRPDFAKGKAYASRNDNHLRHCYTKWGTDRSQVDWLLTLRQQRGKAPPLRGSASAPNLHEGKTRPHRTKDNEEGVYHSHTQTMEKYQNYANTRQMCERILRVSSGDAPTIDWQCNLRDGYHQKPDALWKRYFTGTAVSFDRLNENCVKAGETYRQNYTTPIDRVPDLEANAIHAESLRKDEILFKRWPGCEGSNAGCWRHMVNDHKHGYKTRGALRWETTLREDPADDYGARIQDSRSEGCLIEMLGKKKWNFANNHHDALSAAVPKGDTRLNYLQYMEPKTEVDEPNKSVRQKKTRRRDEDQLGNFRGPGGQAKPKAEQEPQEDDV